MVWLKKTEHLYALKPVEIKEIARVARSVKNSFRQVQRARIILQAIEGGSLEQIASYWHLTVKTVKKWLNRFLGKGANGLADAPRSGRPPKYSAGVRAVVVSLACQYPGEEYLPGVTHWSIRSLTTVIHKDFQELGRMSRETIREILVAHHLKPHRLKYFLTRTDPNFFTKAAEVIKLYLSPPKDGIVVCVDERTGIQALERKYPGRPMVPGQCQGHEFEYKRHGTFCLIAGLNILTGKVFGRCYKRHTNVEFRDFLEGLMSSYSGKKLYIVLDNLKTHLHKNVQELRLNNDIEFVFLPFHGSWLNQVEIWFSILNRKCVRRMDVKDIETGQEETLKFVNTWNINWSHPFKWEYTIDDLKRLLKIDEQIALPKSPDITA